MDDFASGGLSGGETQPRDYFYLVFNSKFHPLSPEEKSIYYNLGVSTGADWVFILVDDNTDNRLEGALKISETGKALLEEIRASIPCFIFTNGRLKSNRRIKEAKVHKIEDFGKSVNLIYDRMGIHPPSVRKQAIEFFRTTNKIVRLNPNLFGIGFDFNAFFGVVIDRFDPDTPPIKRQ